MSDASASDPRDRMLFAARSLLEKRRREVLQMLRSCGVDPRHVPLSTDVWRDGASVHLERFVFSVGGRLQRDKGGPIVEEFSIEPDVIPEWIPLG